MNGVKDQHLPTTGGHFTQSTPKDGYRRMSDPQGLIYAIGVCALGGFIGQYVFSFFKPKIGLVWAGGVAALIGFFAMVMVASITQALFGYPPIQ